MKRITLSSLAAVLLAGVAGAEPSVHADRVTSRFVLFPAELTATVFEVPLTLGGLTAHAAAINENGEIAGWSTTSSSQTHAFFWSPSNPTVMADVDPMGGSHMMAFGMNDNGVVVGWRVNFNGDMEAFAWSASTGKLKYFGGNTVAFDVNNGNKVVGAFHDGTSFKAATWTFDPSTGGLSGPNSLGIQSMSIGRAINELGDVAGLYVSSLGELHGFVKKSGQDLQDVGVAFGNFSDAYGLNGGAWASGETGDQSNGDRHAFLWASEIADLEPVTNTKSAAFGVNDDGLVVGRSNANAEGADRAILWGPSELRLDLGSAGGSSLDFATARAINGQGQIAGFSTNADGNTRATIWTLTEVEAPPPPAELTAVEKIDLLIAQVEGAEGLNKGQKNSLIVKLKAARNQLTMEAPRRGRSDELAEKTARNIIRAFTLQVHAFLRSGLLDDAESLLKLAGEI